MKELKSLSYPKIIGVARELAQGARAHSASGWGGPGHPVPTASKISQRLGSLPPPAGVFTPVGTLC